MAERAPAVPLGKLAVGLALQAFVFTAAGAAIWYASGRELRRLVDWTWQGALGGALFGLALIAVAAAGFRLFPTFLEKTSHLQSKMAPLFTARADWRAFVFIALCAGISEEAFFRAGLQTWLGDRMDPFWAILLSAGGFALIHMAKPMISALIFLIGIVFGAVYWWTGSLLTVMLAHAIYDVWALRVLHGELQRLGYLEAAET